MTDHLDPHHTGIVPPPGCPAHDLGQDGIRRLYGQGEADPRALHEELRREHGAVAPVLLHGDLPAWLVLGYDEIKHVTTNPLQFTRDSGQWAMFRRDRVPADSPLRPTLQPQPVCVFADGEEHARLRGAVTDSLEQFALRGIRRYTVRYARQLIDEFAAEGRADLISQFAERLPMMVMTRLLGMPEANGPQLANAALDLMRLSETAMQSNEFIVETLRELVKRRRDQPGQDLPSMLLSHPSGLTEDEVLQHLRLILVAANETTVNLMANTLRMVLTDRRFRASLSGGHMTLPDALDQILWDAPPMSVVPGRVARERVLLGNYEIQQGDLLLLGLAAGNVDPAQRPDLAKPLHGNRAHLAFSSGPHECPGKDIGRSIAEGAIDTLLAHLPDLQLAVDESELATRNSWLTQRQETLPVRFTPKQAEDTKTRLPLPPAAETSVAAPAQPAPTRVEGVRRPWWKRLMGAAD
ncbi:cytochrome P450 [Streptomyces chattanoogensis]|uniref:cytochrome P450 n=1 Tax=Streptomyces chattanoogensis TaxID=66876 RepID=UPI00368EA0B3